MDDSFLVASAIQLSFAAIAVTCVAIYFFLRKSREITRLKNELSELQQQQNVTTIQTFLAREQGAASRYRVKKNTPVAHINKIKRIKVLRKNWLAIEEKALVKGGDRPSREKLLNELLLKLYDRRIKTAASTIDVPVTVRDDKAEKSYADSQDAIATLLAQIEDSNKTINVLNEKLKFYELALSTAEQRLLNQSPQVEIEQVEGLREKLSSAEKQHKIAQEQISAMIESQATQKNAAENEGVKSQYHHHSEVARLQALLDKLQGTYDSVQIETDRLRESNSEKRRLLLKLEAQLGDQSNPDEGSLELIAKLKAQLQDSEICTAVLESETDSLRERISVLNNKVSESEVVDEVVMEHDEPEDPHKLGVFSRILLDTINNITASNDMESLAKAVLQLSIDLDIQLCVILRNADQDCWSRPDCQIDSNLKETLLCLKEGSDEDWIDIEQGCVLTFNHFVVLLYGNSIADAPVDLYRLAKPLSVANVAIKRIELQEECEVQKVFLDRLVSKAHSALKKLEAQNKSINLQGKDAIITFEKEIDDFFETVKFTDIQRECMAEIVADLNGRISIILQSTNVMDKSYVNLIALLNEKREVDNA